MTGNYRLLTAILLIPLLCFFTYKAIKSGIAAVQLTNARYLLQENTQYGLTEEQFIKKTQNALDTVKTLTANDPVYHKLSGNLKLWQAFGDTTQEDITETARQYYVSALQKQPDNPYLWSRLAQTDLSYPKKEYSINAINQASYYAPSDKTVLLYVVRWKIMAWKQLSLQQQNETIEQLKRFASGKQSNRKTREQVNHLLKISGQKVTICSKLPRTHNFKTMCQ